MRSMTGYGRGESVHHGSKFSVELNSVNRKQSDIVVTLPREWSELEPRIRDLINAAISRGRLTVLVACRRFDTSPAPALDAALARSYYELLLNLQKELGASGEISIETILRAPGVMRSDETAPGTDEAWPLVAAALQDALRHLIEMRTNEGENLAQDLRRRLEQIGDAVRQIRRLQPAVVQRHRQLLHERIQRAGIELPLDDERLTREVVFFAERSDISEELTRLDSHFAQFAQHLQKEEPIGRTLEFLSQEIGREFNTLGAKANDVELSQLVVSCKAEMEKIREQIQNIE